MNGQGVDNMCALLGIQKALRGKPCVLSWERKQKIEEAMYAPRGKYKQKARMCAVLGAKKEDDDLMCAPIPWIYGLFFFSLLGFDIEIMWLLGATLITFGGD